MDDLYLSLGFMFLKWAAQMRLDRDDWAWLRRVHRYAVNDESGLPEAGRFNAGQKMLFWLQILATLALFVSGLALWLPETFSRSLRLIAIVVHSLAAVASMGLIILHIYMGTAAVPGSFRAMVRGWVRPGWARTHHAKWHRERTRN